MASPSFDNRPITENAPILAGPAFQFMGLLRNRLLLLKKPFGLDLKFFLLATKSILQQSHYS